MDAIRVQSHLKEIQDYINYKSQRSDASLLMLEASSIIVLIGKEQMDEIITYVKLNLVSRHVPFGIVESIKRSASNKEKRCRDIIWGLAGDFIDISDTILITLFDSLASLGEEHLKEFILNPPFKEVAQNYKLLSNFNEINTINDLVMKLLDVKKENSILHADCGIGSFLLEMAQKYKATCFCGYSSNIRFADIAKARAYICDSNIQIDRKEIFTISEQMFDGIYVTYPFNIKYDMDEMIPKLYLSSIAKNNLKIKRYSSNMLSCVFFLEQLSHDGKMIVLVPEGGLFNSVDKNIRELMINNNYLDAVISLPVGILSPYTGVKSSLLVLKKNRALTDKVIMIDAEEMCHKTRRETIFTEEDIDSIVNLYVHSGENKYLVTREEIVQADYYLSVQKYIDSGEVLINGTELGKMCTIIFRGYQINAQNLDNIITDNPEITPYRIINISDLTNEGFIVDGLTPVVIEDISKVQKFLLEDGDIVLTAKNTTIKCAVYEQKNDIKTILSGNLIAIRTNKKVLNPFYLKTFLDSETGKAQLSSIQTGTSIKTITPKNLEKMEVSLLPKTDQDELSTKYVKKLGEVKELINKYVSTMNEIEHIYDDSIEIIPN